MQKVHCFFIMFVIIKGLILWSDKASDVFRFIF